MKKKQKALLVVLAILVVILIVAVALSAFFKKREQDACHNNQRMIAAVIESCVLERGLYEGDTISPFPIDWFPSHVLPKCPSGGEYIIPLVGQYPYCTYHGHLLDETGVWSKWPGGRARKRTPEVKNIEISQQTNSPYSSPESGSNR